MLALLTRASRWLVASGWVCRTGGAQGADQACERGALDALGDIVPTDGSLEIFLPWPTFGSGAPWYAQFPRVTCLPYPHPGATMIAELNHPAWQSLRWSGRALHARNVHQVLGPDLASPSAFVLCWTKDAADGSPEFPITAETGGTGQALRIAAKRRIHIRNLANPDTVSALLAKLG
jgi:hypothetical protein